MTERSVHAELPDDLDADGYVRTRGLMRLTVMRVWRNDRVVAGMDPWNVVDEAWASMAEGGFSSAGPFLPFALRVAKNKALDAINRAEARRYDRSLQEPLATGDDGGSLTLEDVAVGSQGADEDYFAREAQVEAIEKLALVQEAITTVLTESEQHAFLAVRVDGKSRAAVGRELDPPVTGQRVGQIVAAALTKIKTYVDERHIATEGGVA